MAGATEVQVEIVPVSWLLVDRRNSCNLYNSGAIPYGSKALASLSLDAMRVSSTVHNLGRFGLTRVPSRHRSRALTICNKLPYFPRCSSPTNSS